jgi:hypothetical protein
LVRAAAELVERPQASERLLEFQGLARQVLLPLGPQEPPERHDAQPAQKSELSSEVQSEVQQDARWEHRVQPALRAVYPKAACRQAPQGLPAWPQVRQRATPQQELREQPRRAVRLSQQPALRRGASAQPGPRHLLPLCRLLRRPRPQLRRRQHP